MTNFPHAVWHDSSVRLEAANPLLPYYATRSIELASVSATSATDITTFAIYYDFFIAGTLVLNGSGMAQSVPYWWADLYPMWASRNEPYTPPPYPTVFADGIHSTTAQASGAFDLRIYDTPNDNATGRPTQTAIWHTKGHSEGMRRLPGPGGIVTSLLLGINFDSNAAGYSGIPPNIIWTASGYFKAGYGSASPIT